MFTAAIAGFVRIMLYATTAAGLVVAVLNAADVTNVPWLLPVAPVLLVLVAADKYCDQFVQEPARVEEGRLSYPKIAALEHSEGLFDLYTSLGAEGHDPHVADACRLCAQERHAEIRASAMMLSPGEFLVPGGRGQMPVDFAVSAFQAGLISPAQIRDLGLTYEAAPPYDLRVYRGGKLADCRHPLDRLSFRGIQGANFYICNDCEATLYFKDLGTHDPSGDAVRLP